MLTTMKSAAAPAEAYPSLPAYPPGRRFFTQSRYGVCFGIRGPDRGFRVLGQWRRDVAAGRREPGVELLLLHHEAQELLGRLRVLGVLHDHLIEEQVRLGRHADRADRVLRVVHVLLQVPDLLVGRSLRRVVDRDAVVGQADLAIEEGLVVVRVQPRQRARDEGGVHLLGIFERLDRLRAVDHDLVVRVHQFAAMRPEQPVRPQAVARRIAQGKTGRRALGVQRLEQGQECRRVLGEGIETRRLDLALAVDQHRTGGAEADTDPLLAVGAQIGLAGRVPAAVLLAQVVGQVGDVEQLLRVEVGVVVGRQDDVRAGAGVGRDGRLRAHVFPALVVDTHLDAGLVGELLDVDHVGVDVALHEAAPAQHAQLGALLGLQAQRGLRVDGGRPDRAGAERRARGDAGGPFQEAAAVELVHAISPCLWAVLLVGTWGWNG